MLRKGQPVKFSKPMSTMRVVLGVIENGAIYKQDIVTESGLKEGQVRSALFNLTYVGCIKLGKDREGRTIYIAPGTVNEVSDLLLGINSIFNHRFTSS
jgi:transcription initiation factor IIE alpha subunit